MSRFRKHSIEEKRRRSKLRKQRKKNKRKYQDTVKQGTVNCGAKETENSQEINLKVAEAQVPSECPSS